MVVDYVHIVAVLDVYGMGLTLYIPNLYWYVFLIMCNKKKKS